MKIKFEIPVPSRFEIFLAKMFGTRRIGYCLSSWVEIYHWRGKDYVTDSGEGLLIKED